MNAIQEQIRNRIAETLGLPIERISDHAQLADLVQSSFLLVELIIDLQEEFGVRFGQAEMQGVSTIGQMLDLFVDARPAAAKSA